MGSKKIWGLQHFCSRLGIEKFPVDDEFDKKLVLIWGYWVKKGGALKINTEFCYIQINFLKIKSFEVTKIVKFAVIASLGQKGHF